MIVKCLISYVTIQIFRPNGLLLWFLYYFKKKFPKKKIFQNFQKVELWSPIKGSRVIFEQKHFGIPPIITQELSKKIKKSWNFHHRFFSYWQLILISFSKILNVPFTINVSIHHDCDNSQIIKINELMFLDFIYFYFA